MKVSTLFPSKFVRAADLEGRTITLTIKELKLEEMGHGEDKELNPVLYFKGTNKGMVLNRTNALIIAALYSEETDDWIGQRISIYPTKVRAFGKMQDCIRVREQVPPPPKAAAAPQVEEPTGMDEEEADDGDQMWEPDEAAS